MFAVNLKSKGSDASTGALFKLPVCSWVNLLIKKTTLRQCKLKALNHDLVVRAGAHGDIPFTVCWSGWRCAVVAADRLSHRRWLIAFIKGAHRLTGETRTGDAASRADIYLSEVPRAWAEQEIGKRRAEGEGEKKEFSKERSGRY